jgi:Leucine-rich repeat (LRR) protein
MRHLISFTAIFLSALLLISGCRRKEPVSPPSAGSREPTPPSASPTEPTQEKIDNAAIVRKAVAQSLHKKPEELTTEDYEKTTVLFLSDTKVSDLMPIKELKGLKKLYLSGTAVSNEQVAELKKALPELTIRQ